MNKVEIIKGINATIAGLEMIKTALGEAEGTAEATPVSKSVAKREKAQAEAMNAPVADTEGSAVVGKFDVEQLKSMKYNDFKKLAAQLGVKCTGTRDEIMERILALDVTVTADGAEVSEPVAEAEDEAPAKDTAKSDRPATGKKKLGKKADEPARDEFDEQAEEIAKDTPVEDIISALADVDIKATKKNAVEKLAHALREGLIELDGEDEETAETTADEAGEDGEDISADSYFEQFDPNGYNDPANMTDERKEAIEAKMDEILTAVSEGNLTEDDITSYIEDNATEAEIELLGDDYTENDLIAFYMELVKRTIDNEGEEHEPSDPYECGEVDMCCGHELKYVKKSKMYVCSQCGSEYEAE